MTQRPLRTGWASTVDSDAISGMEDAGVTQGMPPPAANQADDAGVQEERAQDRPSPPHKRTG